MYKQLRKSTIDSSAGEVLLRILGNIEDIGLTTPKATRESLDTLSELRQGIKTMRATASPESAAREAAQALADGTGTIADVLNGAAAKTLLSGTAGSAFASIFDNALAINSRQVHKELAALGDTWITKVFRPTVNKHVAFIRDAFSSTMELDPMYDRNQADFLLHSTGVAETWGDLRTIHNTAGLFRSYGIIPSKFRREDEYEFTGPYPSKRGHMDDTLTWFLWADQQGMTPGIYTETEATAHEDGAAA